MNGKKLTTDAHHWSRIINNMCAIIRVCTCSPCDCQKKFVLSLFIPWLFLQNYLLTAETRKKLKLTGQ